jgi:hypothetical protein
MGQTEFNSEQLADSPTNGKVLTSDGEVNSWTDPAALPGNQNLWLTAAADSGSEAATTKTSTLTIAGGDGVTTALSGNGVAATITISSTRFETYVLGDVGAVPSTLLSNGVAALSIAHAGTIVRIEAYVASWITVVATDTLTVILEYGTLGGTATTTITSTDGAEATFGADKSIAVSQGDILKATTTISDNDTVAGVTVVVTIEV